MTKPQEEWEAVLISAGTGYAGYQDGALSEALFNQPCGMCCDSEDNIYVVDTGNHCIRKINNDNTVETVVGIPGQRGWKDGDLSTALLNRPRGITIDKDNNLYIADFGNARIRKVSIKK